MIIIQGMRPHWLRLALLVLLVAGVVLLPPIRYQPSRADSRPTSQPLAGSFRPTSQPLAGSFRPSHAELLAAIDRANSAFRSAHERADLMALDGVATGAWLDEERRILADLRANGITEHWIPRSFKLISLVVAGTTATACTDEEWDLVIVDAGGQRGPPEPRHHVEQYTLQRMGSAWLVSAIEYDTKRCGA
jgi:hypothetical protein